MRPGAHCLYLDKVIMIQFYSKKDRLSRVDIAVNGLLVKVNIFLRRHSAPASQYRPYPWGPVTRYGSNEVPCVVYGDILRVVCGIVGALCMGNCGGGGTPYPLYGGIVGRVTSDAVT